MAMVLRIYCMLQRQILDTFEEHYNRTRSKLSKESLTRMLLSLTGEILCILNAVNYDLINIKHETHSHSCTHCRKTTEQNSLCSTSH
jgi:hypothetical protein